MRIGVTVTVVAALCALASPALAGRLSIATARRATLNTLQQELAYARPQVAESSRVRGCTRRSSSTVDCRTYAKLRSGRSHYGCTKIYRVRSLATGLRISESIDGRHWSSYVRSSCRRLS